MIIDAHGHLGAWFAFAIPDSSTASLVRVMDRCGVATMCVSHLLAIGPDSRAGNALLLEELEQYPGRFLGYAVVDPHDPQAAERAADLLARPDVIGLKLHPDTHEHPLDGPGYEAAFELAAEHDCIVLAHGMFGSPWCGPEHFATVAARDRASRRLAGRPRRGGPDGLRFRRPLPRPPGRARPGAARPDLRVRP
jgi:predicted TIM-barrel fold metal-dependent hydrolase